MVPMLLAIGAGLVAGLARAWAAKRLPHSPPLVLFWLVPVALLPQFVAFYVPSTSKSISQGLASIALVSSLALLLVFAGFNRRAPGIWLIGIGLLLNLIVILLNGSFMPTSPEIVQRIFPFAQPDSWQLGSRVGTTKNIALTIQQTRLWWLSDLFILPAWAHYRVVFSIGDILISLGSLLLLWSIGGPKHRQK